MEQRKFNERTHIVRDFKEDVMRETYISWAQLDNLWLRNDGVGGNRALQELEFFYSLATAEIDKLYSENRNNLALYKMNTYFQNRLRQVRKFLKE